MTDPKTDKTDPAEETETPRAEQVQDDAKAAAASVADAGVKTLYALAGLTDAVAEHIRKQAEAANEARQQRAAERESRRNDEAEKLRKALNDAPDQFKGLPETLRVQFEKFLEAFDELAGRGKERVDQVREQVATSVREGAKDGRAEAEKVAEDAAEKARAQADESVAKAEKLADDIDAKTDSDPDATTDPRF